MERVFREREREGGSEGKEMENEKEKEGWLRERGKRIEKEKR